MEKRTIEKILKYNFSEKQIEEMKKSGIINGCGGKGGVNFSDIIEANLNSFKNFEKAKLSALWNDIELLCHEHDLDYFFKKGFTYSNFVFALGVFRLIKNWTKLWERITLFLVIFFLLQKYGKKYYK
ncbi:hypothetical protein BKN14_00480 [Candidatus Gracilibacteria bacterium HOT-871]|nr:hypothetical protein BKN14_00480 [Candidatus Gracilibacteria bacterium HOT-871]